MDGAVLNIAGELSGEPTGQSTAAESVDRPVAHEADTRLRRAFERCGEDLYRFIVLRVNGDRHAADDLLQQTCYEAARHQRTPGNDDAAQAWLFGIAKNIIRKYFRRLRREARHRGEEAAACSNPSLWEGDGHSPGAFSDSEIAPHLLTAIAALNETDQQLLLGSYFEGRSHEELASAIGVSVRAIEGRLYRARLALRETLSAELGEDVL